MSTDRYVVYLTDGERKRYVSDRKVSYRDGGVEVFTSLTDDESSAMRFDVHQARYLCGDNRKFKLRKTDHP